MNSIAADESNSRAKWGVDPGKSMTRPQKQGRAATPALPYGTRFPGNAKA
jgi:hypothetical protein